MYDGGFAAAFLDMGAQKLVCGLAQARAYAPENPGS